MNTVKKITLISLITAFMCCTIFCVPTSALLLNDEVTSIEYLDNGDRIETVISYKAPDKSSVTVNSSTKAATKTNFSTQKINVRHPIKFCVNNNPSSNNKTVNCGVIRLSDLPRVNFYFLSVECYARFACITFCG